MSSLPSSSSSDEKKLLYLLTADNQVFEVEESLAIQAKTIGLMVEDGYSDGLLPLPAVRSKELILVLKWCKGHPQEEKENPSYYKIPKWKNMGSGEGLINLKEWEAKFCYELFRNDEETFFELVKAANYLEVEDLLDQLCEHIAWLMRGKSPEQIRDIFHIKNDFTPEEEAAIRQENSWAFKDFH